MNSLPIINFKGKLLIKGNIKVVTGLHIGGSTLGIEIGGLDNPVIKNPQNIPYIPGSSLKGKLRTLLEISTFDLTRENFNKDKPHSCEKNTCNICLLFGRDSKHAEKAETPNRLIIRDSFLNEEYFNANKSTFFENLDNDFTEIKQENSIDRLTSSANPRTLERVPAGSIFKLEMILTIFHKNDINLIDIIKKGLKLLEDDYLGGSGTRGSGKIIFENLSFIYRTKAFYECKEKEKVTEYFSNLDEVDLNKVKSMTKNETN